MAIDIAKAASLFKQRKDMMPGINQRDDYIEARLKAVVQELAGKGIHLVDTDADMMFLVDVAVWQYNNRDNMGGMPEWLRLARRERWLNDSKINADYEASQAEVETDDS